jgi:hypothetical protein
MVGVAGGELAAEDVRVEGAIDGLATVRVSGGSARFERATITLTGTGTAVEGDDAAIELLATVIEAPFGTAVMFRQGHRLAVEGGKVTGAGGVTVEAGAPDVHLAAANVATKGTALRFSAAGRLTIYGGQFLAEEHAFVVTGEPLQVGAEGALFVADRGPAATIEATLPDGETASFVGSRFAARGEHVGATPTPAVHVAGSGRVEFSENMAAASRGPALVVAGGAGADLRGNVLAGVSSPLVFEAPSALRNATTEAELIVSTGAAEPQASLSPDLDPATNSLAAALTENPDLGRRIKEAASAAAQGSEAAFDELSSLADELRRSCEICP